METTSIVNRFAQQEAERVALKRAEAKKFAEIVSLVAKLPDDLTSTSDTRQYEDKEVRAISRQIARIFTGYPFYARSWDIRDTAISYIQSYMLTNDDAPSYRAYALPFSNSGEFILQECSTGKIIWVYD